MVPKTIHASITASRVMEACVRYEVTLDNPGFCLACGEEADGIEPDLSDAVCDACGCHCLFGASEILIMEAYHNDDGLEQKGSST